MRIMCFVAFTAFAAAFLVEPTALADGAAQFFTRLDPRFYGPTVSFLLWCGVVWSALDLALRKTVVRKFLASGKSLEPDFIEKRNRIWNVWSAGAFLIATLIARWALDLDCGSVTRSLFQTPEYSAPSLASYFRGRLLFIDSPNGGDGYRVLGLATVAYLFCESVSIILRRFKRAQVDEPRPRTKEEQRDANKIFTWLWSSIAAYFIGYDLALTFVSFLNWAIYNYYFVPLNQFINFSVATRETYWGLAALILIAIVLFGIVKAHGDRKNDEQDA